MDQLLGENSIKNPLKEFQLLDQLGEGSYGAVWKGIHIESQQVVAIKKVPVDNDLEELTHEIDIMKQLSSDYIIKYYNSYYNSEEQELWIVMEYCGAGSVCDLMKICDRFFEEDQIAVICKYALKGLEYLHSVMKIHRDIKAGNILLNENGEGKLADFGVSGQLSDTMAKRQTVTGTPFWMAPEVIQEVGYDYKADLWSLGITAIEMADGAPPYSDIHPMRAIFMIPSKPPPTVQEPSNWSELFLDFISKCLIKNPEERPNATTLLEHEFIKNAPETTCLLEILKMQEDLIQTHGREELLGLNEDETEESEEENKSSTQQNDSDSESDDSFAYGTFVKQPDSKDEKDEKKDEDFVPQFAQMLSKNSNKNQDSKKNISENENENDTESENKFSELSLEDLKKMLIDLDEKKSKEISEIKEKYKKERNVVDDAINSKKEKQTVKN